MNKLFTYVSKRVKLKKKFNKYYDRTKGEAQ